MARAAHAISLAAAAVWAVPGVASVASGEVPADHAFEAFVLGLLVAANAGAVVWSWFHERRGGMAMAVTGGALAVWALGAGGSGTPSGIGWAVLSGAGTSGLGYALWYSVVPRMTASTAAVAMLSVPVIALVVGVVLLNEPISVRLIGGAMLVIGGIAFAVRAPAKPKLQV